MGDAAPTIEIVIDRGSRVPAYRQLADEIRYRIATGAVPVGMRLPNITDGGKMWQVNLHTVRKAYAELAAEGLVEMQRGRGTTVSARLPAAAPRGREGLGAFVDWIAAHAEREFGVAREDLAHALIATQGGPMRAGALPIIECSAYQAAHHAAEIADRWNVTTRGWSLEQEKEPPAGPFVATYFHYNDIRRRWPHRLADGVFVSIRPAEHLAQRLAQGQRANRELFMVEYEETMARSIAADVSTILPPTRYALTPFLIKGRPDGISFDRDGAFLFSPRVWSELAPSQRTLGNTFEVEYAITDDDHRRLARLFNWDAP